MTDLEREAREALAETAREVACHKVGECFTQGTDVLLIARAVKAAKYAYLAAAAPREQEIEELRAELAKTKLPIWMLREEHEQEVSALRARVAELEAALVGASKLSPLPETNA